MFGAIFLVGWSLCALVIYSLISSFVRRRQHARLARQLGCEPPPILPTGFLGIRRAITMMKAQQKRQLQDAFLNERNAMQKMGKPCNTLKVEFLNQTLMVTYDPKNVQALLATQFKDFALGPIRFGGFYPLLGTGIFSTDGSAWEHSRTMLRPQFARSQVEDTAVEEYHLQNFMQALQVGPDGCADVEDIQTLFFRLTMDSATEMLFGESLDTQLSEMPGATVSMTRNGLRERDFAAAFDKAQYIISEGFRLNELYWIYQGRELKNACKNVHDFADYFVKRALNQEFGEKRTIEDGKKEKYVFLEALAADIRDPRKLRDELLSILTAGRDTTAALLGYLWYSLAKDPVRYTKLRQTAIDHFGTYQHPKPITFTGLKNCAYLQYCMNETLRLFPVVPLNSRRAVRDTSIPVGGGADGKSPVFVPKDTEVNYYVHVMHRMKEIWGPDVEDWKPERFENRKSGWEYLPFNGGPRICLGQQSALTKAGYTTVRLLQRFERVEPVDLEPQLRHKVTLTSRLYPGLHLRLFEASG
ncbi:putative cytochrome P450 family protein [Lineolata rhizophorae]|uniref:Putative cytochrome P450 family protein n=1 Tax=Lineolata rhizophorae TaxID=578093 RepID=A0A6A6P869_9PEZI|nr:putative cytochrome P450 family protein [Lineolata rhizophorae]